jgi:hypothetical protein
MTGFLPSLINGKVVEERIALDGTVLIEDPSEEYPIY